MVTCFTLYISVCLDYFWVYSKGFCEWWMNMDILMRYRKKNVWVYVGLLTVMVLLFELTTMGVVLPLWMALLVSIPTFGYLYAHVARLADVVVYNKIFYKFFDWDPEEYSKSWFGILIEPAIALGGYAVGVALLLQYQLLLQFVSIGVLIWVLFKVIQNK